jgi:hypothetical protein
MRALGLNTVLVLMISTSVHAGGPVGIAYAEAPEAASGVCTGNNPEQAFACARARCAAAGVAPAQCLRVAWCFPAGWSVDVFVQDMNGLHGHEFSCGWPTREMAELAGALHCDQPRDNPLGYCATVRLFDPAGSEVAPAGTAR